MLLMVVCSLVVGWSGLVVAWLAGLYGVGTRRSE